MAEQLNIQFGVDASKVVRAAEQAGQLAGKLFGDQFNKAAEQQLDNVEVQLDLNFKGESQAKSATKQIELLRGQLKKAEEAKRAAAKAADKMALADAKAANKKKALAKAIGKVPLKAHASQLQRAINKLKTLQSQTVKGSEAYKRLGTSIGGLNKRLANMGGQNQFMKGLSGAVGGLTSKFALANVAAGLVTDGIRKLGTAAAEALEAFTQRAKNVEALTLALQNAGIEGKDVQKVMGSIKATALTFGTSMDDVSAAWKRLGPTILAAGGNIKDVEKIIIAMSARTVGLGLNAEQTGRYMEALAQVMGKGKLQGEELTKQLSQLDGALRSQIEQDLKKSVEGFTSLEEEMRKGAVTADMFAQSFIRVSQGAVDNLTGEMFNLQQQIKNTGEAGGLTIQQIENKINTLNTISLDGFAAAFDGFGKSIQRAQAAWAQFNAWVVTNAPATMSIIKVTFDGLGKTMEITAKGILLAWQGVVLLIEAAISPVTRFIELVKNVIPPEALQKMTSFGTEVSNVDSKLFDMATSIGAAGKAQITFLEEVDGAIKNNEGNWDELGEKLKGFIAERIAGLEEVTAYVKQSYEEEKASIQENVEVLRGKLEEEKLMHEEAKAKIIEKYNEEKQQIDEVRQALDEAYGRDMAALDQKTTAEKRLQEIRRSELQARANNAALSEKERVSAQAQLDAMTRRNEKAKLRNQYEKDKLVLDQQSEQNEKNKDQSLDKQNAKYEKRRKVIDENLKAELKAIDEIDKEITKLDSNIRSMKNYEKDAIFENRNKAIQAIQDQTAELNVLIRKWNEVETAARRAASAGKGAGGGGVDGAAATGGPVSSGRTYTVNEVGQEAFLSAAGKLSMIDAPAWGQWTAPTSGTVIPAHLTSQLEIPRGGINLNGSGMSPGMGRKLMNKKTGQKAVSFIRGKVSKTKKGLSSLSKKTSGGLTSSGYEKKDALVAELSSSKVEASIPPYLSKEINIPSTKIKSNKNTSANSVSSGNMLQIARAIKSMQTGNSISNNVTIQSNNPTQAAGNMMVQLAKLKRARYS